MNDLPAPDRPCPGAALYLGDCREVLPALPGGSFDLVFTDPPYPCIKRNYGTWTEAGWWGLMRAVVPECMRLLKPTGSAVFVLQPNSERVGRMRTWLWEFQLWVAKTWGVVQDAYWWNTNAIPEAHSIQGRLMRPSVKACVWVGPPGCYRNQPGILWTESGENARRRLTARAAREERPSGHGIDRLKATTAAVANGGVLPFNLFPSGNAGAARGDGFNHPAATPLPVCDFWVCYLCPPGGAVLDPFSGTATTGLAALKHGCDYAGIEVVPEYHATAGKRLAEATGPLFATPAAAGVV
jgi:hypothetical protein